MSKLEQTISRPSSNFEKYYFFRNELRIYTNFAVTATYSQEINECQLFTSLRSLALNNYNFSSNFFRVDDAGEEIILRQIKQVKFQDVFEYIDYDKVDATLLCFLHDDYWFEQGVDKPLWKVFVLNDKKTVVFLVHHGLFDGESGVQFHLQLLQDMENYVDSDDNKSEFDSGILFDLEKDSNIDNHVIAPGEELINHKPSWAQLLDGIFHEFVIPRFPKVLQNYFNPEVVFKSEKIPFTPPRTTQRLLNIPIEQVNAIYLKCHELGISLTLWLTLCLQFALKETFQNKSVPCDIAINLRGLLPEKHNFGLFVCGYDFLLRPISSNSTREDLIKQATIQSRDLKIQVAKGFPVGRMNIGSFGYVPSIKDYLRQRSQKPKYNALDVSNLGIRKVGATNDGELGIEDMFFTGAMNAVGGLFCINCISTDKGGLNINFTVEPGFEDVVSQFDAHFEQWFGCI